MNKIGENERENGLGSLWKTNKQNKSLVSLINKNDMNKQITRLITDLYCTNWYVMNPRNESVGLWQANDGTSEWIID